MSTFKQYFAIEKRIKNNGFDVERAELIEAFTDGKTSSLKKMSYQQYKAFITWLKNRFNLNEKTDWQNTPENKMRRKIWVIFCKQMHYTEQSMYTWVQLYGRFHKPLKEHNYEELVLLVTQAETVYQSFIKGL